MKLLYVDFPLGISAEMLVGALLDLGCDIHFLAEELAAISFGTEIEIKKSTESICGISPVLFLINSKKSNKSVSESELLAMLKESGLSPFAKHFSSSAFLRILKAKHEICPSSNEIIFPLDAAAKSIASICSVAIFLELFRDHHIVFSPLDVVLPSAHLKREDDNILLEVEKIFRDSETFFKDNLSSFYITSEGAAICAQIAASFLPPPPSVTLATGYGLGFDGKNNPLILKITSLSTDFDTDQYPIYLKNEENTGLFSSDFGYNMTEDSD